MLIIPIAVLPELVKVSVWAAVVVPTCSLPKARLGGKMLAVPLVAAPLSCTSWGLLASESLTVSVPMRVPEELGVNDTETEQLLPGLSWLAQELTMGKSLEFEEMLLMVSTTSPWLVKVTVCEAPVDPSAMVPKLRLTGVVAAPAMVPVPVNVTFCGLPAALSATETLPVVEPAV